VAAAAVAEIEGHGYHECANPVTWKRLGAFSSFSHVLLRRNARLNRMRSDGSQEVNNSARDMNQSRRLKAGCYSRNGSLSAGILYRCGAGASTPDGAGG